MKLKTERLLIREFVQSDFNSVHEYASDSEVVEYMPFGPNTPEETKEFLDRVINLQGEATRTDFELAVILKESNKLIGGCRINKTSDIEAHIGYICNKKYWGKGYATEAAHALVDYGFNILDVHRIYATCEPKNIASKRVLEKVGMVLEGRLRENMVIHGRFRDSLILSTLKHEWENRSTKN